MQEASKRAGGTACPSLFSMITDAFVRKEKVHDICNQTPDGHNERCCETEDEEDEEGEEEEESQCEVSERQYKSVRTARYPVCPDDCQQEKPRNTCTPIECCDEDGLPPANLRCRRPSPCPPLPEYEAEMIPVRRHCRQTQYQGKVPVRAHCRRAPSQSRRC